VEEVRKLLRFIFENQSEYKYSSTSTEGKLGALGATTLSSARIQCALEMAEKASRRIKRSREAATGLARLGVNLQLINITDVYDEAAVCQVSGVGNIVGDIYSRKIVPSLASQECVSFEKFAVVDTTPSEAQHLSEAEIG